MRQVSVERLKPGMELARDVKLRSAHPNVLYKLRVDANQPLTESQIERLKQVGTRQVYLKDEATEDLSPYVVDDEVEQAQEEVLNAFDEFRKDFESNHSTGPDVKKLRKAVDQLIESLQDSQAMAAFTTLKSHDDYTANHSLDVTKLSLRMALENENHFKKTLMKESGVDQSYVQKHLFEDLGIGAMLHDLGKGAIDRDILKKPGDLSEEEWERIKDHPREGFERLREIEFELRAPVKIVSFHHHEKYDGTGYPQGLSGNDIHLYGRISACTDVYSALTSKRSYREAKSPAKALQIMSSMQEEGPHFDPEVWETFKELVYPYPVGQTVYLDDGSEGVVCEVPADNVNQPVVRVLLRNDERLQAPEEIQVNRESTPSIVESGE